jgi:hypothetical protein
VAERVPVIEGVVVMVGVLVIDAVFVGVSDCDGDAV